MLAGRIVGRRKGLSHRRVAAINAPATQTASRFEPLKRPLRIGVDAHVVGRPTTGNERVMINLIPALREVSEHELFLYFDREEVAAEWRARAYPSTAVRCFRSHNPLVRLGWSLPVAARRDEIDVLLGVYNRSPFAPCPTVTIVHDVSFARFPDHFSRGERAYMKRTIPASMRRSAAVVTVSEFSRDEITALYGIPAELVTVAHDGVDGVFRADELPLPPVDPPYFLSVGSLQPRKNLPTLIRAYSRLLELHPGVAERLVITGRDMNAGPIYGEAERLRRDGRIVFTGHVDDSELAALYRGATALAYPSIYEGFGLPPIEAMASGTPVVVADIPVTAEVAGEAAMRVPATDSEAWADALWRLCSDEGLRSRLAEAGRVRSRLFTWQGAARSVLAAIERVG